MINNILAAAILVAGVSGSDGELRHDYVEQAYAEHIFDFKQPEPKTSDRMYTELVAAVAKGDPDATRFYLPTHMHFLEAEKAQGLDEPEDVYVGCVLYQVGGLKALHSIDFNNAVSVIEGLDKPDNSGKYTAEDSKNLVNSWNKEQTITAWKLWYEFGKTYAPACYSYIHHGFIVGVPKATEVTWK